MFVLFCECKGLPIGQPTYPRNGINSQCQRLILNWSKAAYSLRLKKRKVNFKKLNPDLNLRHQLHFMHLVLSSERKVYSTHNISHCQLCCDTLYIHFHQQIHQHNIRTTSQHLTLDSRYVVSVCTLMSY